IFLKEIAAGTGLMVGGGVVSLAQTLTGAVTAPILSAYRGPNVVLIRYGGGARRRESIDPEDTYSPFLCRELIKRGTLFKNMEIAQIKGLNTSHGEGTLNIVTGKYD